MINKKYILIIFDTNNIITEETIKNAHGLKYQFCDITTLNEVLKNKSELKKYRAILDCTVNNVFYNSQKRIKNGYELIEKGIKYIKTSTNNFIGAGPNISQLTATKFNSSRIVLDNFKKDYNSYITTIRFLLKKIPETKNQINFDTAIKTVGIDISSEIKKNKNEKVYKLVKEIPSAKDPNVEYITYENVMILNKLKEIIDFIC